MKPIISVIIPVFNVASYLSKCLESILKQTLKNIEVIAVNDGSADNSGSILNEFAMNDNRLKVIHKENMGVAEARNEGLKHIQGQFVSFVDSDDWIEPQMYESMYKLAVEKNLDIVMCGYVREFIDYSKPKVFDIQEGRIFDKAKLRENFIRKMIGPVVGEVLITENLDIHSVIWNKIYRTNLLKDLCFKSLKEIGSCEDLLFNLSVFNRTASMSYINKAYYHYRKTSVDSITNRYRPNLIQQRICLINHIRTFIDQNQYPNIYHQALNNRLCMGTMGLGLNIISANNDSSFLKKMRQIKELLSTDEILMAFRTFNSTGLAFHWKVFYFFARTRNAFCYYSMLKMIKLSIALC